MATGAQRPVMGYASEVADAPREQGRAVRRLAWWGVAYGLLQAAAAPAWWNAYRPAFPAALLARPIGGWPDLIGLVLGLWPLDYPTANSPLLMALFAAAAMVWVLSARHWRLLAWATGMLVLASTTQALVSAVASCYPGHWQFGPVWVHFSEPTLGRAALPLLGYRIVFVAGLLPLLLTLVACRMGAAAPAHQRRTHMWWLGLALWLLGLSMIVNWPELARTAAFELGECEWVQAPVQRWLVTASTWFGIARQGAMVALGVGGLMLLLGTWGRWTVVRVLCWAIVTLAVMACCAGLSVQALNALSIGSGPPFHSIGWWKPVALFGTTIQALAEQAGYALAVLWLLRRWRGQSGDATALSEVVARG